MNSSESNDKARQLAHSTCHLKPSSYPALQKKPSNTQSPATPQSKLSTPVSKEQKKQPIPPTSNSKITIASKKPSTESTKPSTSKTVVNKSPQEARKMKEMEPPVSLKPKSSNLPQIKRPQPVSSQNAQREETKKIYNKLLERLTLADDIRLDLGKLDKLCSEIESEVFQEFWNNLSRYSNCILRILQNISNKNNKSFLKKFGTVL